MEDVCNIQAIVLPKIKNIQFANMKKNILILAVLFTPTVAFAQQHQEGAAPEETLEQKIQTVEQVVSNLQKLKVSGYIQNQYQWGEQNASLKVGGENENPDKSFNRWGIRRGRIKFTYDEKLTSGVFQLDITERGVVLKDLYFRVKDPWLGSSSLTAGVFDRPFGYEIGYSSSRRESPERSTIVQLLFPDMRDLGVSITLQPAEKSPLHFLKLEAGLFAGNGIKRDTDSKKDFIGHLSSNIKVTNTIQWGLGVSYYKGYVYQGTENVYTVNNKAFTINNDGSNVGEFAHREYFGMDSQLKIKSAAGITQLRGEYLFGTQPGTQESSRSPNSSNLIVADTYIRNFEGGYIMLVQDVGKNPFSLVVKYDWYNPNIKVSGNEIGLNDTGKADIAYNSLGVGFLWDLHRALRLQVYYDIVTNETTENLPDFASDRRDNQFTLRLQYKF